MYIIYISPYTVFQCSPYILKSFNLAILLDECIYTYAFKEKDGGLDVGTLIIYRYLLKCFIVTHIRM